MLSRMKSIVLTLLILLVVVIGTVLNAMRGQIVPRESMGDYGGIAYDYVSDQGYKIIGCQGERFILTDFINASELDGWGILNFDLGQYFAKFIDEYQLTIIKHVWCKPKTICVYIVDSKIAACYYVDYDDNGEPKYSLDGKYYKKVTVEEHKKLWKKYIDKWNQYLKDNNLKYNYNF